MRSVVVLALCLAGGVVLARAAATPSDSSSLPVVPLQLDAWEGQDLAVDDRTKALLGTDQVMVREYHDADGTAVWMAVVYAAENRSAFHPPELCYTGSNFELLDRGMVAVEGDDRNAQPINRLLMANGRQHLVAYYWFTAGDRLFANYHHQQWQLIWNQIRRRPSGGTLVRLSTVVDGPDVERAEHRLAEMARLLITAMHTPPLGGATS
jgi:EpsI family protein